MLHYIVAIVGCRKNGAFVIRWRDKMSFAKSVAPVPKILSTQCVLLEKEKTGETSSSSTDYGPLSE